MYMIHDFNSQLDHDVNEFDGSTVTWKKESHMINVIRDFNYFCGSHDYLMGCPDD